MGDFLVLGEFFLPDDEPVGGVDQDEKKSTNFLSQEASKTAQDAHVDNQDDHVDQEVSDVDHKHFAGAEHD